MTSAPPPPDPEARGELDTAALAREIEAEARARVERGEFDTDRLVELQEEFTRWAPVSHRRGRLDDAISLLESTTVGGPARAADRPPGAPPPPPDQRLFARFKRLVQRVTAGIPPLHAFAARVLGLARRVRYGPPRPAPAASPLATLGLEVARPLRLVAERLDEHARRLERLETVGPVGTAGDPALAVAPRPWSTDAIDAVVAVVGTAARTVVAHAPDAVTDACRAAGADVYPIDPALDPDGGHGGLADHVVGHLGGLRPGVLGGVVIDAAALPLTVGGLLAVADHAAAALRPGGTIVLATGADTEGATATDTPTDTDGGIEVGPLAGLVPAPADADAWRHVLASRAFAVHSQTAGGRTLVIGRR